MYERRLDYKSILSRSGHAVAHDEERRAFERLGKRAGQKAQVAKFGEPVALGVCRFRDGSGMLVALVNTSRIGYINVIN